MKYLWSAAGSLMIAIPALFFDKRASLGTAELISERTQDYITTKKLLLGGAEAAERIMLGNYHVNYYLILCSIQRSRRISRIYIKSIRDVASVQRCERRCVQETNSSRGGRRTSSGHHQTDWKDRHC